MSTEGISSPASRPGGVPNRVRGVGHCRTVERCGLQDIRNEAYTEVVCGGSLWARWWIPTLEVINELGGGDEASRREVEVMTTALADPTVWELLHARWGRRGPRLLVAATASRSGESRRRAYKSMTTPRSDVRATVRKPMSAYIEGPITED